MMLESLERKTHHSGGIIESYLAQHDSVRNEAINLIVSENRMSKRAMAPLSSDIQSRYAAAFYSGTDPAQNIISYTTEMAKKVFSAKYANLSPISGNISLLAAVFALSNHQNYIGRIPPFFPGGGYPLNYEIFDRKQLPLPFSDTTWQLDLNKSLDIIQQYKPPLVVLGSSIVTYPMPVKEIAECVHQYGGLVAYDGSHTLGLIAGGQYQDPLREGADVLLGSTHKTFPGPQGGIILTNSEKVKEKIDELSNFTPLNGPTMICNPHLARIAATGIVLEETPWKSYAKQVVENARTIAGVFKKQGVPLQGMAAKNFSELTYSHQVLTRFSREQSLQLRDLLYRYRINVDAFFRIGTSEITRLGYKKHDCELLANIIASLINNGPLQHSEIVAKVDSLINAHREVIM